MSARRHMSTALVALLLAALGFTGAAMVGAWAARDQRAKPWRKMRVEHEGTDGVTTRTRVIFDNAKLPLVAVELTRTPEGKAESALVEGRGGEYINLSYDAKGRPRALVGPDGAKALLVYKGSKARVTFIAADGKQAGSKVMRVPVELRPALKLASASERRARPDESLARRDGGWWLIGEASAQEAKDEEDKDAKVTVKREVRLALNIKVPKAKDAEEGPAQVEASCPPFTCLPVTEEAQMGAQSDVRVAVTGITKRSALQAPPGNRAPERFAKDARKERQTADRVLPQMAAVLAAARVTTNACRSLKLAWPICLSGLTKKAAVAAIDSVEAHETKTTGTMVDRRALDLYYQEQARIALDKATKIEVCVSRHGFSRGCVKLEGRPLASKPMAAAKRSVELRRGLSGALAGTFDMTQHDGSDCKFSPSPKTDGAFSLAYDEKKGELTAKLKANARGTRPNLRCSLGTGDMRWNNSYSATASQAFTQQQMQAGGKLTLRLLGTMSGSGGYSWSACRTSSGGSVNCPAGKGDTYSYPIKVVGELDLDTQRGSGRILVNDAPLTTKGSWRVPAGGKK